MQDIPLLEFDSEREAIIEPDLVHQNIDPPEHCVMPIYGSLIERLKAEGRLEKISELYTSLTPIEVSKLEFEGSYVTVAFPGMGAPFVAAIMEELIALGCRKFVACGSAGVLKSELQRGAVVIPSSAVRDEGTSYHYLAPCREIEVNPEVVQRMESVLHKHHINYEIGKTWTTDALFRETKSKVSQRKSEGCIAVEMECSAFLAVARFRDVMFGQYLAAGDDVSGDEWDPRYVDDRLPIQEKIFWLSVEACLSL
jgi:uridine phosphorylase